MSYDISPSLSDLDPSVWHSLGPSVLGIAHCRWITWPKHTHTQRHTDTHRHLHAHTEGGSISPWVAYHFLILVSPTWGLQHFLPAHHKILKPGPTVSHGDLLEEVGHSSVLLTLLLNPPPSRMIYCPVPILWIKAEAHFSTEAKLPGSTDVSILFTPARHPALQGQRVWPHQRKERAQALDLTNSLPHCGPPPLGPGNLALFSPLRPAPSTGLLGKDQYPIEFFTHKQWMQLLQYLDFLTHLWTRWTWVWATSGSWWRTGKPGVLQSMGLQRVGHDWVTKLNWTCSGKLFQMEYILRYTSKFFFSTFTFFLKIVKSIKKSIDS